MSGMARRELRRAQIMDAAARRFSSGGFARTRMSDVAADLEMKAGSLYYYFDSKEALLAALIESHVGVATTALEEIVVSSSPSTARIRAAVESHLTIFAEHPDLYTIFVSENFHAVAPELAEQVDSLGRRYEELWVKLIAAGIEDGSLRADVDPWVTMKAIVGLCNSMLFWYEPDGRLKPVELADAFSRLVLDGLVDRHV